MTLSSDPYSPDYWGPGCDPRWWNTGVVRQLELDGKLILQQQYVLQSYGADPCAEEWRDVPTVRATGSQL